MGRHKKELVPSRAPRWEPLDPKDLDRRPVSGPQFVRAFPTGSYYIRAYDKYFGRVVLSADQLYLGNEQVYELNHASLAPVEADDVPEDIREELLEAAKEAGMEWL